MARDYALLHQVREDTGFVRLYRWSPPCLSFGRNEPARRRYDRTAITAAGIDVVRRPTGGRAVWHDRELTYAVAAPVDAFDSSLRRAYLAIHRVLADALHLLGLHPELAPYSRVPTPDAGACFVAPVGGEILIDGSKVVGSAQVREGAAFLQHGSILLADEQDRVRSFLRETEPPTVLPSAFALGAHIAPDRLTGTILQAMEREWGGTWHTDSFSTVRTTGTNFEDPDWTWRK